MSDLISREALLEAFDDYNQGNALVAEWRLRQIINNAPAIEQGEVVARLHVTSTDTYPDIKVEVLNGADLQPSMSPINVYTTPQQPQSVADVLEDTIKIVRKHLTGRTGLVDLDITEAEIRALIKRNMENK